MQHSGLRGGFYSSGRLSKPDEVPSGLLGIVKEMSACTQQQHGCAHHHLYLASGLGQRRCAWGTSRTLTCHTSHMRVDFNRGRPCWQLAHCCWRTCYVPHLAGAAGHSKAAVIAVAPLDLVDKVVDGAAGNVGKDLVQVEDGGDVCAAHTAASDRAGGLLY